MSNLDEAIEEHMAFIVLSLGRPFSFKDFSYFKVGEKEHRIAHGTFRNKMVSLKKKQVIELDYKSGIAFYTLKGHKFGKAMTPNHTGVGNDAIYNMIKNLPMDKQSIHDIRLRLKVPNISKILSLNPDFHRNQRSNDIMIPSWSKNNAIIRIIVHQTDLVSVIIACSFQPIPLDINGIIDFSNLLVWVQAKLESLINTSYSSDENCLVPDYKRWIITMWHFGRDALTEYTGEKFSITVEQAQHILTRVYVKDFNGKNRIRIERQEYPKKTVVEAINEKLDSLV